MGEGARLHRFVEHFADGRPPAARDRALAVEAPVALEINGVAYAVMMATPTDLDDYALGFCLSEQLIESPAQFRSVHATALENGGWIARIDIETASALLERARLRLSEGSCGLCGIESLEQVLRPLPPVITRLPLSDAALFRAVQALPHHQTLGRETRAVHAAAFCSPDGVILALREDVGRHNAFDKLIGALAREGRAPSTGFVLLSARCSYELVQKAVLAGVPALVTLSAASTLAVDRAHAHGLALFTLARDDSVLES